MSAKGVPLLRRSVATNTGGRALEVKTFGLGVVMHHFIGGEDCCITS